MKKLFFALSVSAIMFAGCEYDDSWIKEKLEDHEDRIVALERICSQMNDDIRNLNSLVDVLKGNDMIEYVEEIMQGDEVKGYKIVFTSGKEICIYDGADGKDGKDGKDGADGAVINVRMAEDGQYYWVQTINGKTTWLYDDYGNKIPVHGKDAVTPLLKVDSDGYWIISYDGGYTYARLLDENGDFVRAEGRDGDDGKNGNDGDSFFESVELIGDELHVVLSDGTEFVIPIGDVQPYKAVDLGLSVKWANCNLGASSPEQQGGKYLWGDGYNTGDPFDYVAPAVSKISGTDYDVVKNTWGGNWRIPTKSELKELAHKCSWSRTTINGVYGMKFTGSNGNYIFLPPTGLFMGDDVWYGTEGYYMSGESYLESEWRMFYVLNYDSSSISYNYTYNADVVKMAIRPVKD